MPIRPILAWPCLWALAALAGCHAAPLPDIEAQLPPQYFALHTTIGTPNRPSPDLTFGTYNTHGLDDLPGLRADFHDLNFVNAWALQEFNATEPSAGRVKPTDDPIAPFQHQVSQVLPPGDWYGVYVPVNHEHGAWEGQAIVTRWPIKRLEIWPLERSGRKRRVALAAWLDTPQGELLFVNTDHETQIIGLGPDDRAKQIASLTRHLAQHPAKMTVLGGDFNTAGDWTSFIGSETESAALDASLAAIGFAPMPHQPRRLITFRTWPVYLHLDHLYTRGLRCVDWDVFHAARGSDHYPVWCQLKPAP